MILAELSCIGVSNNGNGQRVTFFEGFVINACYALWNDEAGQSVAEGKSTTADASDTVRNRRAGQEVPAPVSRILDDLYAFWSLV